MITILRRLFIDNWQRKLVSLILAMIVWMVVNHSMAVQKTIPNIPLKIINLPHGKTVEGLQTTGILSKRITLTLTGNRNTLEEVSGNDLEVIIDAAGKGDEWIATITKKNLISINPDIDVSHGVSRISHHDFIIKLSKMATEKIPVIITQPIGEAPRGYQYLDVWPYQLYITITGPEEAVKKLKTRGLKLTFNLNDVKREELASLQSAKTPGKGGEEISYFVPDSWKKISLPMFSETPLAIDDPMAKGLRIDFVKTDLIPIGTAIPVALFFPIKYSETLNPDTYTLATNDFIKKINGIKQITTPLFAKGVTRLFVDIVADMMQIVIVATPKGEKAKPLWSLQFVYPHELEDRYVAKVLAESSNEIVNDLQPTLREEYLRNRFRSYMHNFRLYTPNEEKLTLDLDVKANTITVTPKNSFEKKKAS